LPVGVVVQVDAGIQVARLGNPGNGYRSGVYVLGGFQQRHHRCLRPPPRLDGVSSNPARVGHNNPPTPSRRVEHLVIRLAACGVLVVTHVQMLADVFGRVDKSQGIDDVNLRIAFVPLDAEQHRL